MIELSLEYSIKGTPYIEMFELGRLIFSKTLKTNKGYKWLCYIKNYNNKVNVSTDKNEKQIVTIPEQEAICYTMKLYRDTASTWGVKTGTIPKPIQKWFRKTFKILGFEEEDVLYFPESKLAELEELIENTNFEKMVHPPKKRTIKKRSKEEVDNVMNILLKEE